MPDITKTCRITGRQFVVTQWEQTFVAKMGFSLPTLCIEERHRQRLSHRNERKLYKRTCELTGEPVISVYSADKPYRVYSQDAWWSDQWDARDYGREYNFSRPFFEQFLELRCEVPRLALSNIRAENSEYCNLTNSNKNCYLVFGGDYNEDCRYSIFSMYCRDTSDVYLVIRSELAYDCIDCKSCYDVRYCQDSQNCRDSNFLFDCRDCSNCVACVGLRNKRYCVFNKEYSKEEYEKKLSAMRLDTWSGVEKMKAKFQEFSLKFPRRFANIVACENSSGNRLINAKNCINCFEVEGPAEDLKDVFIAGFGAKDFVSCDHVGFEAELHYECSSGIEGYNCAFCLFPWTCRDTYYCDYTVRSANLFGCSGMHRAEYCILNKEYSRGDYLELREKIIAHMKETGEWGEFFPMEHSLFCYNETVAHDVFPLTKESALEKGLSWFEEERREGEELIALEDCISDVRDDIVDKALVCEKTGRPYRIIPQELEFHRKQGIPIPRFAPETRNEDRIKRRSSVFTWSRECGCCGVEIETCYDPSGPEKVYCEKCYLAEVYG